jgi:hypothetical protein
LGDPVQVKGGKKQETRIQFSFGGDLSRQWLFSPNR